MLGTDLVSVLNRRHEVIAPGRGEMDITDRKQTVSRVWEFDPDVLINCAAYTDVDGAEKDRITAFRINHLGAQNLAMACLETGAALCHISTDYVFDGVGSGMIGPYDHASPLNVYGMSKLAGEKVVAWALSRFYIVRTSWLYGRAGSNFVEAILEKGAGPDDLRVVNDQVGAPTWTMSLASALEGLIESGAYGIYHYTDDAGAGVSWYDFAVEILQQAGLKTRIHPVPTSEFPRPARRPERTTLDCSLIEMLAIRRRDWKTALSGYMKERAGGH